MSYTWGSIAIITIIIIKIIIIIILIITVVVVVVVAAVVPVVGARTVQPVEQLGYEREAQRTAIRFRRPLPALAITEPPISWY
jgi:flagellar basal body-associated protein FliL